MNFIEANSTDDPLWKLEYDACKAYNCTVLSPDNWSKIVTNWIGYLNKKISKSKLAYIMGCIMGYWLILHCLA